MKLYLYRYIDCSACEGRGHRPAHCICDHGQIHVGDGVTFDCSRCGGTAVNLQPCPRCDSAGTLRVKVEAEGDGKEMGHA